MQGCFIVLRGRAIRVPKAFEQAIPSREEPALGTRAGLDGKWRRHGRRDPQRSLDESSGRAPKLARRPGTVVRKCDRFAVTCECSSLPSKLER